jgi:ADP-ribose pyrophosphatase YjhB (NUDIX family)
MHIITTIRDEDFGLISPSVATFKERRASRAVVFDKEKKIALLHVTKEHFHKLPGGGVEAGEDLAAALQRELSEEIGCAVQNVRELGIVEEFRGKFSLHQLSYCFLADLSGEKGIPHLDKGEIEAGFQTMWLTLEDAIKTVEADVSVYDYEGKFIQKRDLAFLTLAAQELKSRSA